MRSRVWRRGGRLLAQSRLRGGERVDVGLARWLYGWESQIEGEGLVSHGFLIALVGISVGVPGCMFVGVGVVITISSVASLRVQYG